MTNPVWKEFGELLKPASLLVFFILLISLLRVRQDNGFDFVNVNSSGTEKIEIGKLPCKVFASLMEKGVPPITEKSGGDVQLRAKKRTKDSHDDTISQFMCVNQGSQKELYYRDSCVQMADMEQSSA